MELHQKSSVNRLDQWISLSLKNAVTGDPGPSRQVWEHITDRLKPTVETVIHPVDHHRHTARRVK